MFGIVMKIGDLVRNKYNIGQRSSRWNSLAIVVGFDCEGDLYLRYVNPTKDWENENDLDYKRSWELVNATD
tara:strand:- start:771 stop:983 length:213 start_codon:yes stop_codon:yes gene_type:complete